MQTPRSHTLHDHAHYTRDKDKSCFISSKPVYETVVFWYQERFWEKMLEWRTVFTLNEQSMGIMCNIYIDRTHGTALCCLIRKMKLKDQIEPFLWLLCGKSTGSLTCRCDTEQAIPQMPSGHGVQCVPRRGFGQGHQFTFPPPARWDG